MFEISENIYTLLNVPVITTLATGGVHALLAPQLESNFVTYELNIDNTETKDFRDGYTVTISCFADSYSDACKMFDAVDTVVKADKKYLNNAFPSYVEERAKCVVTSNYNFKQ